MKNEDIEKAAVNYDSRAVPFRAFVAGAQWRINTVVTLNNESNGQSFKMKVDFNHMKYGNCSVTISDGKPDGNLKKQKGLHVVLAHEIMRFFKE